VIHTTPDVTTEIGVGATVAHQCVVHGAVLEEEALVGNGCVVLDGARIGARSLVAALSLVPAGMQVPPGMLVAGVPAAVKRPIEGTPAEMWVKLNPTYYPALAQRHIAGIRPI
jgi:carbonic anhydrase/acetyltransferase-like protein (isoleucine patch superfamily)